MQKRWLLLIGCLVLVWWLRGSATAETAAPSLAPVQTVLDADALAQGQRQRIEPTVDGVTAAPGGGVLETKPQQVTEFSDALVSWRANLPVSTTLDIYLRVSSDGTEWSRWGLVEEDADLIDERDAPDQHWGAPIFAGKARWWQVQIHFNPAPDGSLPTLHELRVDTVDVGELPAVKPTAQRPDSTTSVPKPPYVTRTQWGSEDGQGSRVPPAYYPVNHMVVHHTVDSNTLGAGQTWWGDRVRAIWVFHTYTRGWGDIGYNFLIAPDGLIFEGRAGGDNAVGFHDTGNYGSMGVSMIGTYSSVPPTSAAQSSLVEVLAWKAQQRGIDPLGSSYYYGCDISRYCGNPGAVTLNIAGHRQVANVPTGYTSCPGDELFDILPSIRSRVQTRISGTADNGDLIIDELETSFTRSSAQWYEEACGDGGHVFYTYGTNISNAPYPQDNWGRWRKEGLTAGRYQIFVHIPQNCQRYHRTQSATYKIFQDGVEIGRKTISQNTTTEWIEITSGSLNLTNQPVEVHLTDLTGEPLSDGREIIFDTVRWVPVVDQVSVSLEAVNYAQTTIAGGELLKVTFRIRNTGNVTLQTQAPDPGNPYDPFVGYTYDEGECFAGNATNTNPSSYPAFPKETGSVRVVLGGDDASLGSSCSMLSQYPWRWGLGGPLEPGGVREIVGYVRFRNTSTENRVFTLKAGVINEYVTYLAENQGIQTITVTPERLAPQSVHYNSDWQPLAQVSTLGAIPDDFLARTANPLSIPEETILGNLAWDGQRIDWGNSGPFGRNDMFVVRQSRTFVVPVTGAYKFRVTSDDGAWLWIDGVLRAETHGLHPERESETDTALLLSAGEHVLSFKYFERTSQAVMSYEWMPPGSTQWQPIPVQVGGGAPYANGYFGPTMRLTLGADDLGGSGVNRFRWSLNNGPWTETSGNRLGLTSGSGNFTLFYQAIDNAGNIEPTRSVSWKVDGTPPQSNVASVTPEASGLLRLVINRSDSGMGVASIDIEVRDVTTGGSWYTWQTTTHPTAGFFGSPGHTYEFRSRAIDLGGNREATHSGIDATGTVPAQTTFYGVYLPTIRR